MTYPKHVSQGSPQDACPKEKPLKCRKQGCFLRPSQRDRVGGHTPSLERERAPALLPLQGPLSTLRLLCRDHCPGSSRIKLSSLKEPG